MEFALTQEQLMIQDSTASFLAKVSDSAAIRQAMQSDLGYSAEVWQQVCNDLFLHGILIPEEYGGMGLGYVELVSIMQQMGRFLFCSPYFASVCLATNALLLAGSDAQKSQYLEDIIESKTASLAFNGLSSNSNQLSAEAISAHYEKDADGFVLNGEYRYVIDGHSANFLILAARQKGSVGRQGVSLFVCPADKLANISRELLPTMDQTRKLAHLKLKDLHLDANACMKFEGEAWPALERILQLANIALAAEQTGGAQRMLDMSVEYTLERQQFNRSIASFQAIKHKAADMQLKTEVSRSAIYYAACAAQAWLDTQLESQDAHHKDSQDEDSSSNAELIQQLPEAASMAKAQCSDTFFYNAGSAIQLFGGVGFTWEYDIHLYFKRAKASQLMFGGPSYHRELIAQLLLGDPSDKQDALNAQHSNKQGESL